MDDLRNLLSVYESCPFKPKKYLELNPSFGLATHVIRGADADLIYDRALIDIKTSKNLEVDRDDFNRQIGYYILNLLDSGEQLRPKITSLGFYFARHGVFVEYKIDEIVIKEKFKPFMKWFKDKINWSIFDK